MKYKPRFTGHASTWGNPEPDVDYFKGDRIEDTGGHVYLHGAHWAVWRYLEGPRKGQECLRPMKS